MNEPLHRFREIISYTDMVQREGIALQKGMNFRVRGGSLGYSIILMSLRKGAPYQDQWHESGEHAGLLEYEGHDAPRARQSHSDPKSIDQPERLSSGSLNENGKFFQAAIAARLGNADPEIVQVYEKISAGVWCNRGRHLLVDVEIKSVPISRSSGRRRKVFRFYLRPTNTPDAESTEEVRELAVSRQIPTQVKVSVWKRDQGKCVICNAQDNLHFDHDVPFSKGGSSITAENVRLLCARHNLQKSDKIIALNPWLVPLLVSGLTSVLSSV